MDDVHRQGAAARSRTDRLIRQLDPDHDDVAPSALDALRAMEFADRLEAFVAAACAQGADRRMSSPFAALVVEAGRAALDKLAERGQEASLSALEAASVELAAHLAQSRPVFFLQRGEVMGLQPGSPWAARLTPLASRLRALDAGVGRIGVRPSRTRYEGTGFVIAPGRLATSRRVAQSIGVQLMDGSWRLYDGASVDFSGDAADHMRPSGRDVCEILTVESCDPEPIFCATDPANHIAILHFVETRAERPNLPIEAATPKVGDPICVLAYPSVADVFHGGERFSGGETADIMGQIVLDHFGLKRLAPGRILASPATSAKALRYDASPLAGSPGAPVIDLRRGTAVGIHLGRDREGFNLLQPLTGAEGHMAGAAA